MEDRDENKLQGLLEKFTIETEKTVKLIDALRARAVELAHKGERILLYEVKQNVRKQAITELEKLTEKLVSINIELQLDCIDCPNFVIPYFNPGESTVHKLKFLSGDNPWNFWLIDTNVDTKGILRKLLHKFQNNMLDPVQKPKPAQSVCFIERNKVVRGIILQIKNENRIKLVDCDSNVTKVVGSDKLYKVDEDACSVHASALRCTIAEEPDSEFIELWKNTDLRDMFCNTLREATLGVKILKRVAGSFPLFVVDIELENEDEESSASLREWILGRLMPELKKLGSSENDPVGDYLSEESLSPYYKGTALKVINNEVAQPVNLEGTGSPELSEVQNVELNNLNYSTVKLSEKTVTGFNHSKEDNNPSQDIVNNLENKASISSEEAIISSSSGDDLLTSSSKESLASDCSHKIEQVSNSKLNCHSEEFRPKLKKPEIPRLSRKYQTKRNPSQHDQPYQIYGPTCSVGFIQHQVRPSVQTWHYAGQPLHQENNSWTYSQPMPQPPTWSPSQDTAFSHVNENGGNEVNVMAPEFVPRNSIPPKPKYFNRVEFSKEPIVLRKSATLIKENENLLVMISYVENPSEFYVHFLNKNNQHIDKLSEDMFTYYSTKEKIEFVSLREARTMLGKFCACKWSEDNHWYRVEVLDWTVGNNQVEVWFVDYGNTECVPLTSLQPLAKAFEKLSICCQACHLAKVHPVTKEQPWSKEAVDFFKSKVEANHSRIYSITVVQSNAKAVKQNSFSVLLYEGKATDSSKSINDLLVEKGLAWSRTLLVDSASSRSSEKYHSMEDLSDQPTTNHPKPSRDLPLLTSNISDNPTTNLLSTESNPLFRTATSPKNVPELDDDFENWDPRREDYESVRNNPALDIDDACVAVSGYSARDETRICKFYARDGFCFKTVCYKEHSMPNPDGTTTDKEEVYVAAFSQLELPKPGEVVRLKITHVFNINLFYAQIEEKKGIAVDDEFRDEAETLTSLEEYMNQTENVQQMRGLTVPPSPGELVLAKEVNKEDGTEWWYRARVISSPDDNLYDVNPEVMFVDYGTTCIIPERDLRKMEKRYLHLPFQAIECSLANIVPFENQRENLERGVELLQEVIAGQVLTAKIYESINQERSQKVDILLEDKTLGDIGEVLIANGCATEKQLNWHKATACHTLTYYPG